MKSDLDPKSVITVLDPASFFFFSKKKVNFKDTSTLQTIDDYNCYLQ